MTTTLENLLLNDNGLAFDPASGETYRLVGPGVTLVRLLQKGANDSDLLQFLLDEYHVDESTARRDLDAFFGMLEKLRLWEDAS
jgi:PqqD family protein of HPr-rel-A system